MHEFKYPIKMRIQITSGLELRFYWISRFVQSMKCKKEKLPTVDLGTLSFSSLLPSSLLFGTRKRLTALLPAIIKLRLKPRSYKLNEQNYYKL